MADTKPNKPAQRSKHIEPSTADESTGLSEPNMPRMAPASVPEGAPDFATAAASGDLSAAEPTVTQASPDLPEAEKPASELAGSDLQPIEGRNPQGGGTQEPIPRAKPEPTQSDPNSSPPSSALAQGSTVRALPERSAGKD